MNIWYFIVTAMEKADWQQREHERIERQLVSNRQELEKRLLLEKELTRELEATKLQEATVREHNNELMEWLVQTLRIKKNHYPYLKIIVIESLFYKLQVIF